jgi:hypothetical protein
MLSQGRRENRAFYNPDGSHQPRSHRKYRHEHPLYQNTSIYEDFPLTHVEWHIRQQRWDLDMIISKYVYPFSFGLLPNILSGFSNSQTFGVYSNGSLSKQRIVYNSTFNIRAAYVKFFTLLSMIATYFCDFEDNYRTFILGWINLRWSSYPSWYPSYRTRDVVEKSSSHSSYLSTSVQWTSFMAVSGCWGS